ncbi:MAG: peptidase A26, partial [Candidatus Omnitrophica bacterium]|nr:peptidase A26 [Candidatus Omnitrophota bacterium]
MDLEAHYVLGNNIDASETASWNEGEGFRPVGTFGKSFSGSLDGKGYQIQDLFINRPLSDNVGLFGYTEGATLDNVGIDGGSCSGDDYVGGLVGNNVSTRISHCHSAIDVNGSDDIGGLIGGNRDDSGVSDCQSGGRVSGRRDIVGGLIGKNDDNSSVLNCSSTASVSGRFDVGGLIGLNGNIYDYGTIIQHCSATGKVEGSEYSVGGLIGYNVRCKILDCWASGNVISKGGGVGGLIGENYSGELVRNCFATGEVSGTYRVGGLIGSSFGSVLTSSFARGDVSGISSVGGLLGDSTGGASDCYAGG